MSYIMPTADTKENLPKSKDSGTQTKNTSDEHVKVIRPCEYERGEDFPLYQEKNKNPLEEHIIFTLRNYGFPGHKRYSQISGRRNEINVAVDRKRNR